MQKKTLIFIIIAISMVSLVFAGGIVLYPNMSYTMINGDWELPQTEVDKFNEIGDQENIEIEFETEYVRYKEKAMFELVDFVYQDTDIYEIINYTGNETINNGTHITSIKNMSFIETSHIPTEKIIRKYDSNYLSFNIQGIEEKVYFDVQKCWVCKDTITCLYRNDGGEYIYNRPPEFKCQETYPYGVIRSGESGFIRNMTDGNKIYEQMDDW